MICALLGSLFFSKVESLSFGQGLDILFFNR